MNFAVLSDIERDEYKIEIFFKLQPDTLIDSTVIPHKIQKVREPVLFYMLYIHRNINKYDYNLELYCRL